MSYVDLERVLDRAVIFLGEAAAELAELPLRVAQLVEANTEANSSSRLDRPREVIDRCHQGGREVLGMMDPQ